MTLSIDIPHSKLSTLSLSPLAMTDASEMTIHLNDEKTVKYLIGLSFPVTINQNRKYIASRPLINAHTVTFAIRDNGKMIGEVSLVPGEARRTCSLGYYLARPYWNLGITTAAVTTLLKEVVPKLSEDETMYIEAQYFVDNPASGKVLEKCGFTEIGREEIIKDGQRYQCIRMRRMLNR